MPTPDNPRPNRLNAASRGKTRAPKKGPAAKGSRSPQARRRKDDSSSGLFWAAVALSVILVLLLVLSMYASNIRAYILQLTHPLPKIHQTAPPPRHPAPEHHPQPASEPPPAPTPKPVPAPPPVTPKPLTQEERLKALKKKADEETRQLVERPVPGTAAPPKTAMVTSTNAAPVKPVSPAPVAATGPPVVQPAFAAQAKGAPVRALPLDPNVLTTERIAAYQVALERIHFSCGFVDGDQGMRTQRMLRAFQASRGLPVTGFLDADTRAAIGEPGEPFLSYVVTAEDVASIMPKPKSWKEKSKATRLGYNEIWEMLAEKFHCTKAYLKELNRGVKTPVAGTELIGPKVYPAAPLPKAASLRVLLSETSIEALDASGKVIAFFPCSIAKDKNKRPNGELTVKSVVPDPDYTFDPALFADVSKAEGITKKMVIPPGPRNPVGVAWVGLSLPGYGIHGTPDPEAISRTQSHGCFRLANWNAVKVLKMVKVGTPVDVEP